LSQPSTGADVNTWGPIINQNFQVLDNISGASTTVAFTNVNVTLTVDQSAYAIIICSGILTGNVQLIFPGTIGGVRQVWNQCTGAFTLTALSGAGDSTGGILCPQSTITPVILTAGASYSGTSLAQTLTNKTIPTVSNNIIGSTSGSTPSSANIGYSISYANNGPTGPSAWGSVLGVTIQPGNWLIFGRVFFGFTGSINNIGTGISTTNNLTAGILTDQVLTYVYTGSTPTLVTGPAYISVSTPTIYYINSFAGFSSGSCNLSAYMTIIRMP